MDIFERIQQGEYEPKGAYPSRPVEHAILRKRASELTREEAAQLHDAKLDYEQCVKDYRAAKEAYGKMQGSLRGNFERDLCDENGVDCESDFAQAMLSIAWDQGHSHGYSDVAHCFERLMPLWELYAATLVEPKE